MNKIKLKKLISGAVLDRNGLRPSRFYVTNDKMLIMASEVGVYDVAPENVILKSRLKPGRMLLVDTEEKSFIQDIELKTYIAKSRPHSDWLKEKVSGTNTILFFNFLFIVQLSIVSYFEN